MSKHSTSADSNATAATESLKRQPKEDSATTTANSNYTNTTIHEDFVLMSTPDQFKDKPEVDDNNVHKRHRLESPLPEIQNLNCLLVADTSTECAPIHLQNILNHYECPLLSQGELLFLLVYTVALESGFVSQDIYQTSERYTTPISSITSFHSKNVLRLSLLPPSYEKSDDRMRFSLKLSSIVDVKNISPDQIYALLTGFVTGDFLILTLSPANSTGAKGFSVALSIGRFILTMQTKNKPIYQRFRKLEELAVVLRDKIFVPMRSQHLFWLEATVYPSLEAMPPELYDNILQYLSTNQLKMLANVNKSLYNLTVCSKYMLRIQESLTITERSNSILFQLH